MCGGCFKWRVHKVSFPPFFPIQLCAGSWMHIGIYQSGIDVYGCRAECFASEWYRPADGLGLLPVLISGLCPFTFLCHSSLSCWCGRLVILTDDSPKCFNRNVLITGVCVWAIYAAAWTHTQTNTHTQAAHGGNRQLFSYMYVLHFMSLILSCSHWCDRKSIVCVCEQGDRVTLVVRQTILQPDSQRFNGLTCFFSKCPCAKRWPLTC